LAIGFWLLAFGFWLLLFGEVVLKDFRELRVWQRAHALTLSVYKTTAGFTSDERYGLTSQIRRASSSIAANLAEGCGRTGDPEFARYCSIAMGSASELDYHLLLARDLALILPADYNEMAKRTAELKRMLNVLLQKLRAKSQ
jgi:four helix bundle protein